MNRKLVIALLIVLSVAVLVAAYLVSRPDEGTTTREVAATTAETGQQEPTEAVLQPPVTVPVAPTSRSTQSTQEEEEPLPEPTEEKAVEEPEEVTATPVRSQEPMPLPEDPLLARLLDATGGMPLTDLTLPTFPTQQTQARQPESRPATPQVAETAPPQEAGLAKQEEKQDEMPADTSSEEIPVAEKPANIPPIDEEQGPELVLSASLFDRNAENFAKGSSASIELRGANRPFTFGGKLAAGVVTSSEYKIHATLMGTATWNLGNGTVTFPLSVGLGPMVMYDQSEGYSFGIAADANAGIRYMLSDSFGLFASVGVTYQLEIPSWDDHWIFSPIRVGIGFRF